MKGFPITVNLPIPISMDPKLMLDTHGRKYKRYHGNTWAIRSPTSRSSTSNSRRVDSLSRRYQKED